MNDITMLTRSAAEPSEGSKRGRKPLPPPTPTIYDADEAEAIREAIVERVEDDAATRQLAERLGYQLPADSTHPDLICRDIAANMRRSVEAVLEIGKGLIVLKQACSFGEFGKRLEELSIDRKVAARFMQSARKFSNVASTRHLICHIGNQTKLFELLVLDDEQIEELAETGQTGELALDDIACMSVSELRRELREVKAKLSAREKAIADKEDTIRKLQDKTPKDVRHDKSPDNPLAAAMENLREAEDRHGVAVIDLISRCAEIEAVIGKGPRYLAIIHATLEKAIGEIRQAAADKDVLLVINDHTMPKTAEEADREWFERENAEYRAAHPEEFEDGEDE
ncbi:MAG: hypothetical protein LBI31_04970 [Zoogloeaceae bacterium]|nr:hypothetical protein [Zoogloeaceae bacterium]